jgi:hypothetical protein
MENRKESEQNGENVVINELNLTRKKSILKKKNQAADSNLSLNTPKSESKKVFFNNLNGLPNITSPDPSGIFL